jgi:hypothetical protein
MNHEPCVRIRECEQTQLHWRALTQVLARYPLGDLHVRPLICALASDNVCSAAKPHDGVLHVKPLWYCALCAEQVCITCLSPLLCDRDGLTHGSVCPACFPTEPLSCAGIRAWTQQRLLVALQRKRKRPSKGL